MLPDAEHAASVGHIDANTTMAASRFRDGDMRFPPRVAEGVCVQAAAKINSPHIMIKAEFWSYIDQNSALINRISRW
jgi:hypothetical protein